MAPHADEAIVSAVLPSHVCYTSLAYIILPDGGFRVRAPLLLEAVGIAADAAATEIEHLLSSVDCPLEQMPVHTHVGVGPVIGPQGTGAQDIADAAAMAEEPRRNRLPLQPHHADFRHARELGQNTLKEATAE